MHAVAQTPEGESTKTCTGELDISPLAGRELRGARTHLPEVEADPGWSRVRFYINLMDPETFSAGSPSQRGQPRRPSLDLPFEVFVDKPKPLPATPPSPAPGEEHGEGTALSTRAAEPPCSSRALVGPPPALAGPPRSLEILARQVSSTGC